MKKRCTLILAVTLLLVSKSCLSQWILQNSNTTHGLTDVSFVNDSVGYASANFGTIIKTTDGGTEWAEIYTGISKTFLAVEAISPDTVFISRGTLYRSVDGEIALVPLRPQNPSMTFILLIQKLPGGGYTSVGTAGGIFSSDQMYKTSDGETPGKSLNLTTSEINSFSFINDNTGYFINIESELYRTNNGGQSWSFVSIGLIDGSVRDIIFLNKDLGYAVTYEGTIQKTINGGVTWSIEYAHPQTTCLVSIIKTEGNILYVVGNDGVVLKNTDNIGLSEINEDQENSNWSLISNPSLYSTTLTFENSKNESYTLTLFDSKGRVVQAITNITTDKVEIKRKDLTGGLYFFQLSTDQQVRASGKLVFL